MIVFHGSNSNFNKLRIGKNLVKHRSTLDNEGISIYFSTDIDVAKMYGKYIYILEINNKYLLDFRNAYVCRKYINLIRTKILKEFNVDIFKYIESPEHLILRMKLGGQTICGVGHEIYMLLDSNESWYQLSKTKIEKIYKKLRSFDKNYLKAYMFNYHIPNVGVIKDVSDDVVTIKEKIKIY